MAQSGRGAMAKHPGPVDERVAVAAEASLLQLQLHAAAAPAWLHPPSTFDVGCMAIVEHLSYVATFEVRLCAGVDV